MVFSRSGDKTIVYPLAKSEFGPLSHKIKKNENESYTRPKC